MDNLQKKRRLNIGLFVADLASSDSTNIVNGIANAVREENVNIVIFPGKSLFWKRNIMENRQWEYQYNTLFELPDCNNIDGLLIASRSIARMTTPEKFHDFLSAYKDIPTVLMEHSF